MMRALPAVFIIAAMAGAPPSGFAVPLPAVPASPAGNMPPAATIAAPACPPIDDDDVARGDLPHLAAALKPGGTLNVLALGSATMFGPETSATADLARPHANARAAVQPAPSGTGFPWQMVQAMQATLPGLRVSVTALGGHGQPADAMLEKLRAELGRRRYQLVLWQTGTVDAVDMVAPEDFYQSIADGAGAAADAGADLVLIDPQYSRFLEANANMAPYLSALQAAGTLPGVALFNRFDIMHAWVDDGALDLEHADKAERPALAERLHACLGRALARMLLAN